jgi:hypothetical protein
MDLGECGGKVWWTGFIWFGIGTKQLLACEEGLWSMELVVTSSVDIFIAFCNSYRQMLLWYLKISHNCFFPHPFIIHNHFPIQQYLSSGAGKASLIKRRLDPCSRHGL